MKRDRSWTNFVEATISLSTSYTSMQDMARRAELYSVGLQWVNMRHLLRLRISRSASTPACSASRAGLAVAAALFAQNTLAQASVTAPGRYEIIITQELPNVQQAPQPIKVDACLSKARIHSGEAFRVHTEASVADCPLSNVHFDGDELSYRMVCPQPNSPSAKAKFARTRTGYEGTITLDMGAKNLKITERHRARRVGECADALSPHVLRIDARYFREQSRPIPPAW